MFKTTTLVDPAKPQSEDIVGTSNRAAWVLDGTDGRSEVKFSPDEYYSDGVWYVEQFSEYLRLNADDVTRTLREIVQGGVQTVARQYADLHGRDPDTIDPMTPPSSTVSLVRWAPNGLEYYNLADSSIIVEVDDQEDDIYIQDVGPRPFDERHREILHSDADHLPDREEFLREQFRNRNEADHYYVACLDPSVAYNGIQGRIPLDRVTSVLMFTDGVEHLVETYDEFDSWADARDFAREGDLSDLIDSLRYIEREVDPECDLYPRLKQSDDAGVVFLQDNRQSNER